MLFCHCAAGRATPPEAAAVGASGRVWRAIDLVPGAWAPAAFHRRTLSMHSARVPTMSWAWASSPGRSAGCATPMSAGGGTEPGPPMRASSSLSSEINSAMVETALGKVTGSFPSCTRKALSRVTSSANCSGGLMARARGTQPAIGEACDRGMRSHHGIPNDPLLALTMSSEGSKRLPYLLTALAPGLAPVHPARRRG
jgi:hypothetical protein